LSRNKNYKKNFGNINLCSSTTGNFKKNNPIIIKKIPKYFQGSSNFSLNKASLDFKACANKNPAPRNHKKIEFAC
jgi:hypothetical protein